MDGKVNSDVFKEEGFYGVLVPNADGSEVEVYTSRKEAEARAVQFKGRARFKYFKSYEEALSFSGVHYEGDVSTTPSENVSCFKTPSSQELATLRLAVVNGDAETFKSLVWSNPCYLIGDGDVPTILQMGPRYNALHVAAASNRASMCELILDTVDDLAFVRTLFSRDKLSSRPRETFIFSELYLNGRDRVMCETALHLAAKFGFLEVAEVLVSRTGCDRLARNRDGLTPGDVVGTRCPDMSERRKRDLDNALDERCYVPVLRVEDDSLPPKIGVPVSWHLATAGDVAGSPVSPLRVTGALAGPMTPQRAVEFHTRFRSPRGSVKWRNVCRSDNTKGLERIGRELASEMRVPWKERWNFMDSFCDIRDENGLARLEGHLRDKYSETLRERQKEIGRSLSTIASLCFDFEDLNMSSVDGEGEVTLPDKTAKVAKTVLSKPKRTEAEGDSVEGDMAAVGATLGPLCHKVAGQIASELQGFANSSCRVSTLSLVRGTVSYLQRVAAHLAAEGLEDPLCHECVHVATGLRVRRLMETEEDAVAMLSELGHEEGRSLSEERSSGECDGGKGTEDLWAARVDHRKKEDEETVFNKALKCILNVAVFGRDCHCSWEVGIEPKDAVENLPRVVADEEPVPEDGDYFDANSDRSSSGSSFEEMVTPEEGLIIFLGGLNPTKTDLDVFRALKDVAIDPVLLPHTYLWRATLIRLSRTPMLTDRTPQKTSTPLSTRLKEPRGRRTLFD